MESKIQKNTGLIIAIILLTLALATSIAFLLPPFILSRSNSSQEYSVEEEADLSEEPSEGKTRTRTTIIFSQDNSIGDYSKKCLNCDATSNFSYSSTESKARISQEENGISIEAALNQKTLSDEITVDFGKAIKKVAVGIFGFESERLLFILEDGSVGYLNNDNEDETLVKGVFENVTDIIDLILAEDTSKTDDENCYYTTLAIRSDGSFYDLGAAF